MKDNYFSRRIKLGMMFQKSVRHMENIRLFYIQTFKL